MSDLGSSVTCELCGKQMRQITGTHLKKEHEITFSEYKAQFPNCNTLPEDVRKTISEKAAQMNKDGKIGFKQGHTVNAGKTPWNKGTHGLQPPPASKGHTKYDTPSLAETAKKISETRKQMFKDGRIKKRTGEQNPMYGVPAWSRGKTKEDLPQLAIVSKKISATRKRKFKSGELEPLTGPKNPMYGKKLTDEHKLALFSGWKNCKTKPELQLAALLQDYPNWQYVGNGRFFVRTKLKTRVPDFVNTKQKKIIEVYGDYWHRNDNPQDQIDEYKAVGWDCVVLWEHEIMNDGFSLDSIQYYL